MHHARCYWPWSSMHSPVRMSRNKLHEWLRTLKRAVVRPLLGTHRGTRLAKRISFQRKLERHGCTDFSKRLRPLLVKCCSTIFEVVVEFHETLPNYQSKNTDRNFFVSAGLFVLLSDPVLQSIFPIGKTVLPANFRQFLKGGQHEIIGVYEL